MSLERVLRALRNLGLSQVESEIYVFLAKNGPHKGRDIAESLKLYKKQLYCSLKNLQNKEIVKAISKHPAEFSAIPFEEVLNLLIEVKKEQTESLHEIRKELLSSWQNMTKKNHADN